MDFLSDITCKRHLVVALFTASVISIISTQDNLVNSVQTTSVTKNSIAGATFLPSNKSRSSFVDSIVSSPQKYSLLERVSKTARNAAMRTVYSIRRKRAASTISNRTVLTANTNIKPTTGQVSSSLSNTSRVSVEDRHQLSSHQIFLPVVSAVSRPQISNATLRRTVATSTVRAQGNLRNISLTNSVHEQPPSSQHRVFQKVNSETVDELLSKTSQFFPAYSSRNASGTSVRTTSEVNSSQSSVGLHQNLATPGYENMNTLTLSGTQRLSDEKLSSQSPINGEGFPRSLDIHSESTLLSPNQERNIMDWFGKAGHQVVSSVGRTKSNNDSFTESGNNTFKVKNNTELGPCSDECGKNHGVCVMGNDFRPHCVIVSDACDQFHCTNGDCVSTDGLYGCECHAGWVGTFCDTPCTLDCGEHGYCGRVDDNDTVGCICHWNYTGHRCKDKRKIVHGVIEVPMPGKDFEVWEVALIALVAVVSVVSTCVFVPYLLWRRRWIAIRKLVFYFQEFEDDDDKEFDAFLSYKSTPRDEKFILQHLYPKLEKELKFKLCLHFRDFPPGEPIANNIIRAIEGSRRTILILSPNYISSEWCRMEYQKAQYEMLKLKHKIIPIVFEDISDVPGMDKNLKTIIDTVTYIKWPGDDESVSDKKLAKFWKLLELSMPKKRSDYKRSLSSSESYSSEVPLTSVSEQCFNGMSSLSGDSKRGNHVSGYDVRNSDKQDFIEVSLPSPDCQFRFPELHQYNLGDVFTIPLTPPLEIRREKDHIVNSGNDATGKINNEETLTEGEVISKFSRRNSSLYSWRKSNLGHETQSEDPADSKESKFSSPREQKINPFITSDDHIVEIREGGSGITITPRPRLFAEQLTI